ncbi:MAG: site-specific DNA-methyltransferase, partial [Spirochaetaceae bacterium]|nr:site-specific DNA-methyltransferase [Spirochaetaceae bacterium]
LELATRLVRMFSFVGDTVVDPFMGTATTNLAAAISGRNSIGIEIDEEYMQQCVARISGESADLFSEISVTTSAPGSFANVCTMPLVSS